MKQRRFEIFIAVILAVICYFGDYYLKENSRSGLEIVINDNRHSFRWQALNISWLFAMVSIGYLGLRNHESKSLKMLWLQVNSFFLLLLLANKLTQHFWSFSFLMAGTSTIIRTPFLFLMAAYLPRWFVIYKLKKE